VVSLTQPSILHGFPVVESYIFWGYDHDVLVSRDHWFPIGSQFEPNVSVTVFGILGLKDIGVMTLTFWGHVKSSVT